MPDKFNFSKHVSQILTPVLHPLGFRKKGSRFTLEIDGFKYTFEISRSSWNGLPDRPDQLSLHLQVDSASVSSSILLHRITKMKFPPYYAPFFKDKLDWSEKESLMKSFSEHEIGEIDKYVDSISWHYASEEELISLLGELTEQIIRVGLPAIENAKFLVIKKLDSFAFSNELRMITGRLYLKQLEPKSRFPES